MKLNMDVVPSTVQHAVDLVIEALTTDERGQVVTDQIVGYELHHGLGRYLRNHWSLWEIDSPLKRDAAMKYGIAHPDDISGLILDWALHRIKKLSFDPHEYCRTFHEHWARHGTTSLAAGGWPPKGIAV